MNALDIYGLEILDGDGRPIQVRMDCKWRPIDTAPRPHPMTRHGPILCAWDNGYGDPCLLVWKTNHRTGRTYFGDSVESDDYDLADNQPTHWFYVPPLEKTRG